MRLGLLISIGTILSNLISIQPFFSITSLNLIVDNTNKDSDETQCDSVSNELLTQPQVDSAPTINPYQDPNSGLAASGSLASLLTITVGAAGMPTEWTIESSGSSVTDATVPITTVTLEVISTATS